MAESMTVNVRDPLSILINRDVNTGAECLNCARLKLDLKRANTELESVTELIRILREEMFSSIKEVRDATSDGYCKSNESKKKFQVVNNPIYEQGMLQGVAAVEEFNHKENYNTELKARIDKGIEALCESRDTYKIIDRTIEQYTTSYKLYDNSGNNHHFSQSKRSESVMKHIPVIVNAEIELDKGDKDLHRIRTKCSKKIENNSYNGLNKANKHKIMVTGDNHKGKCNKYK
jgi:hypothetical protein